MYSVFALKNTWGGNYEEGANNIRIDFIYHHYIIRASR